MMELVSVHFFVDDAVRSRDWFVQILGMQRLAGKVTSVAHTEVVGDGNLVFSLSSPGGSMGLVADYLRQHPPGVVDLTFQVGDLDAVLKAACAQGCQVIQLPYPSSTAKPTLRWAQIKGWGNVYHTLLEREDGALLTRSPDGYDLPLWPNYAPATIRITPNSSSSASSLFLGFDHAVFNVPQGELSQAVEWYERVLGFERQQVFAIQTEHSGLLSQVLRHPNGSAQLPINEPTCERSQIQDFLTHNRGAGIQHIALRVRDAVQAMAQLRQQGLRFLEVPEHYYYQRSTEIVLDNWDAIAHQQLLVDWRDSNPDALLLQAFTQPIFQQPTFFFELIERRAYRDQTGDRTTEGFGEGNFQALFEAIEREQRNRRTLLVEHQSSSP